MIINAGNEEFLGVSDNVWQCIILYQSSTNDAKSEIKCNQSIQLKAYEA
jgi:hypothetical protein